MDPFKNNDALYNEDIESESSNSLSLLSGTVNFEFDEDYVSDEESPNDDIIVDLKSNPCVENFIKYRNEQMKEIQLGIYKEILKVGYSNLINLEMYKVTYQYDLYVENNEMPVDTSRSTKKKFGIIHVSAGIEALPGIMQAISSMKYNETALFWIPYELMYGEIGMWKKFPPKADVVARIKIEKLFTNDGIEYRPSLTEFETLMKSANHTMVECKKLFMQEIIDTPIMKYKKLINDLENLHLTNEKEQEEVKKTLIKVYLSLCICYNKINNPQKTCLAMRELEKLESIKNNPKALFNKAKALIMLDEFKEAEKLLKKIPKLDQKFQSCVKDQLEKIEKLRKVRKNYQNVLREAQKEIDKKSPLDNESVDEMSKIKLNLN